jgi:hypothetical protein
VIRKPLSTRQVLLLLSVGILIGYPSLVAAGHCAWGGDCPGTRLVMVGVFIGVLSFTAGLIGALILLIRWVMR